MVKYSSPTLSPKNYDMEREWFVYFREYREGEKAKLIIVKTGLNSKDIRNNKRERIKAANNLIYHINKRITNNQYLSRKIDALEQTTLSELLDEFIAVKKSALKHKSILGYTDKIRIFKNWLTDNKIKDILPERFTNRMANQYLEYLLKERHNGGCSHNNHLGDFKNFFNWIFARDRDRFKGLENPFAGIPPLPEDHGKIFALTPKERRKIETYLLKRKDPFYYCCTFMYYLAIRRPDLANIRKEDIDLENKMVRLHSSASKNRRQDSVTIMPEFEKIIRKMGLEKVPNHWYIFGRGFIPSETKLERINDFTEYFRNVATNTGINSIKTFYGFKHAGLSDLFMKTKDPYIVQRHARHSDIQTTMTYLRSLGLIVDEKIRGADIKF